ncbi:ribulose phosphate epimerase [Enhygromyxa salina]|uniref:Uncharacterized protein n=1 Tax=Enhygromyxa salina TaxID=215803 RepID=A0A2S9YXM2_9BACT|nr:ribulose phosphate epimerase [Enhygromyxa salina]PRQ09830.1 hypothetical protein ENSA7_04410 [Enhygromyxa salina]
MSKRHFTTFLSVGLCSALIFAACTKDEQTNTTAANTGPSSSGDGDGDGGSETGDSGKDSGDGDGDPGSTTNPGFVPTEGDIPGANTCDPWAQDCPEGEKCAAYNAGSDTWNANKCVPLQGSAQTGDACVYDGATPGTDDCDVGYMCYYTNEEAVGICVPLCTGSADDPLCEEQFNCSISNDGSLLLCLYSCDPLLQDCSQEGAACFWDGSQFNCDPAGDIPTNEPCGYINDCLPGHLCLDAAALPSCAGGACCATWCELSNPNCPTPGTECIPFYDEGTAPPGLEDVGICAIPGA